MKRCEKNAFPDMIYILTNTYDRKNSRSCVGKTRLKLSLVRSRSKFSKLVILPRVCRIIAELIAKDILGFSSGRTGPSRRRAILTHYVNSLQSEQKTFTVRNPTIDFRRAPIFLERHGDGGQMELTCFIKFLWPIRGKLFPRMLFTCTWLFTKIVLARDPRI